MGQLFLVSVLQFVLFYSLYRTPRTCWHSWKLAHWFKNSIDDLDRDAPLYMATLWLICKASACGTFVMVVTFLMNVAFGNYLRHLISIEANSVDPTLLAIFALTNAACILYAIQAHKDDVIIWDLSSQYEKRKSPPWPPKML